LLRSGQHEMVAFHALKINICVKIWWNLLTFSADIHCGWRKEWNTAWPDSDRRNIARWCHRSVFCIYHSAATRCRHHRTQYLAAIASNISRRKLSYMCICYENKQLQLFVDALPWWMFWWGVLKTCQQWTSKSRNTTVKISYGKKFRMIHLWFSTNHRYV